MQEVTHSEKIKIAAKAKEKLNPEDVKKLCFQAWGSDYRKELIKQFDISDARVSQVFSAFGGGYLLTQFHAAAKNFLKELKQKS